MMQASSPLAFPEAVADDSDDVTWALQTAGVQWRRGGHLDAIAWLRRAVDAARESGRVVRGWDLERQANELQTALEAGLHPGESATLPVGENAVDDDGAEPVQLEIELSEVDDEDIESLDGELLDDIEFLDVDDLEEFEQGETQQIAGNTEGLELPSVALEEAAEGEQVATLPPFGAASHPLDVLLQEPLHDEKTETDLDPIPSMQRGQSDFDLRHERPSEPSVAAADARSHSSLVPEVSDSEPPKPDTLRGTGGEPVTSPTLVYDAQGPDTRADPEPAEQDKSRSPAPSLPTGPAEVGGFLLSEVRGLEDLPDESQAELAANVELYTLNADEEVSGFGLALVLSGEVKVMPAIADVAAARASAGELVFAKGHLQDGVSVRVVAGPKGARVGAWQTQQFEAAIADCPWVFDELKTVGDRFQTLAGIAMGPMGERLDDMLRDLVIARCEVRRLLPGEVFSEAGKPLVGLVVLGAGRIELVELSQAGERSVGQLAPGDFLFAAEMLRAAPAPFTARAGADGALILFADRRVAHELMVSVPPLLEVLSE